MGACNSEDDTLPSVTKIPTETVSPTSSPEKTTTTEPTSSVTPESILTYTVVDTGQTMCYDNSSAITSPEEGETFYGQDAKYEGAQPCYVDNGDGTVTDLNTGLMWQQDSSEKMTYDEAVAGADTFDLAGYDDWRLPTIKKLYSLIDFSGLDPSGWESSDTSSLVPFIDTDYFIFEYGDESAGERIIDSQYASSTLYVNTTMNGDETDFGVNFADGRIKGYGLEIHGSEKTFFVMYVRGNPDYGINDFADKGTGTITDSATGLIWFQVDSGEGMDWEEALAWVQEKNEENYLGYSDWRLPNAKELQSIVDYSRSPATTNSAAIDPKIGDPDDYPYGHGPQGDVIRIYNNVRLVRGADVEVTTDTDEPGTSVSTDTL